MFFLILSDVRGIRLILPLITSPHLIFWHNRLEGREGGEVISNTADIRNYGQIEIILLKIGICMGDKVSTSQVNLNW